MEGVSSFSFHCVTVRGYFKCNFKFSDMFVVFFRLINFMREKKYAGEGRKDCNVSDFCRLSTPSNVTINA